MITIASFDDIPARLRGAFLSVGNFDGVHLGHARLIARLRERAHAAGVPAVALTFDPHPVALLRPEAAPVPLSWTERTVELLKAAGADEVGIFRTGPWLLGLPAREFFDRVALGGFAARGMVEGTNFAFGRDRGGDATALASWCAEEGLVFEVPDPVEVDGEIVSSSRVRRCLAGGRVEEAARLLGRPHRVRGLVVRGAGRGAGLGFPTANLARIDTQIPDDGVYAARAFPPRGSAGGVATACHVGPNSTFGEQARTVEAHLIDFDADLYGMTLQVDFLRFLRPSRKFDGPRDLVEQIADDVRRASGPPG